jgi:hypothetical protein
MQRNGLQVKLQRILAPADFSELTVRTLQYAAAERCGVWIAKPRAGKFLLPVAVARVS